MIRFNCPSCKATLQARPEQACTPIICGGCGEKILVPNPIPPTTALKESPGATSGGRLKFSCPTCQTVYKASLDKAGKKTNCRRCGQRLEIPVPERNKTILAPLVEAPSQQESMASAPASPSPVSQEAQEPEDPGAVADSMVLLGLMPDAGLEGTEEPVYTPQTWEMIPGVLAGGFLAFVAIAGCVAVGLWLIPRSGEEADFPSVLIPVIIVAAIVISVIASGLSSKCPACGKWWGLKELQRREISREPGMKWVTCTDTQRDSQGHTSEIHRKVQVKVMRIMYEGSFRCTTCGHSLNKEIVEEKDSW
jgi:transcription elongation factor Elf1